MSIDQFIRISDVILGWLEKQAQARKKEKAAREAIATNESVKKEEAGSPRPSLPSSTNEIPKEEKVPATPQEEARPVNESPKRVLPWEIVRLLENPSEASCRTLARRHSREWESYLLQEVMLSSTTEFKFLTATEQAELLKQFPNWLAEEFEAKGSID